MASCWWFFGEPRFHRRAGPLLVYKLLDCSPQTRLIEAALSMRRNAPSVTPRAEGALARWQVRAHDKWGDGKHSLDDLLFVTSTQMPYGAAGKLTSKEYVDVVAFILESNGYRAGNKALVDSLSLKQTMLAPQSDWRGPNLASKSGNAQPKKEPVVIWPPALNGRPTPVNELCSCPSTHG